MNVAFANAANRIVSAMEYSGSIVVRAEGIEAILSPNEVDILCDALAEVDALAHSADYSHDEVRLIKHYLLVRYVL